MGNFYTNITLRTAEPAAVAAVLRRGGRVAFVAPPHAGGTTVYDERCETQDPRVLSELTAALSDHFACPALAVLNHDDDILALALYDRGRLIGDFETGHADGFPVASLCRAWSRPASVPLVWLLLRSPRPLFEVIRHRWLARSLGLPAWSVGTGFRYLAQGELPQGLTLATLIDTRSPG
jgi:hypothetical protein